MTSELDWSPPAAVRKVKMSRFYPRTERELDDMSPEDFARIMKRDREHGPLVWPIPRPRNAVWLKNVREAKQDFLQAVLRAEKPFHVTFGTVQLFIAATSKVLPWLHAPASSPDYAESPIRHWTSDSWEWRVAQRACSDLNELFAEGRRKFDDMDVAQAINRASRIIPRVPGPGREIRLKKDWELETERVIKWANQIKKRRPSCTPLPAPSRK